LEELEEGEDPFFFFGGEREPDLFLEFQ